MAYVTSGLQLYLDAKDYLSGSTSTTWTDKSGNGNDGTLMNFALNNSTSGWTGTALALDGVNDYILFNKSSIQGDWTYEVDLVLLTKPNPISLMDNYNSAETPKWSLRIHQSTGRIGMTKYTVADYSFPTQTSPTINVDTHVVYVYNSSASTIKLYINGTYKESYTGLSSFSFPFYSLGKSNSDRGSLKIYNMRVYNRALTDAEVTQNYQDATSTGSTSILTLDGSTFTNSPQSTTWTDSSGNGNDATSYNFLYTSSSGSDGNGGVVLDGTDDYFKTANAMQSLDIAYEMKFKPGTTAITEILLDHRVSEVGLCPITIMNTGEVKLVGSVLNTNVVTSGAGKFSFDGNVHHFVVNVSSGKQEIWLDNVLIASDTYTIAAQPARILTIGARHTGANFSSGTLYYIRQYNRILTSAEVAQNYQDATAINASVSTTKAVVNVSAKPSTASTGTVATVSATKAVINLSAKNSLVGGVSGVTVNSSKAIVNVSAKTSTVLITSDASVQAAKAIVYLFAKQSRQFAFTDKFSSVKGTKVYLERSVGSKVALGVVVGETEFTVYERLESTTYGQLEFSVYSHIQSLMQPKIYGTVYMKKGVIA